MLGGGEENRTQNKSGLVLSWGQGGRRLGEGGDGLG